MRYYIVLILFILYSCNNKEKSKQINLKRNDSLEFVELSKQNYLPELKDNLNSRFFTKGIKTDSFNVPISSKQFYFPLLAFQDSLGSSEIDSFIVSWYSAFLYAMKEPLLFNKKQNKEIYRFFWLRTFHNPIVVRIEKNDNDYKIYWKQTDGAGGYEPGKIIISKEKKIYKEDWEKLKSWLYVQHFWSLPTKDCSNIGSDGSEWVLEGVTPRYYHVVDRWVGRDISETCKYIFDLTDIKIPKKEKY